MVGHSPLLYDLLDNRIGRLHIMDINFQVSATLSKKSLDIFQNRKKCAIIVTGTLLRIQNLCEPDLKCIQ